MQRTYEVLALTLCLALLSEGARAKESIEFVAEHLAEIAMDNRYASLPLWNACDEAGLADRTACFGVNGGYARTHSGTLSFDGPLPPGPGRAAQSDALGRMDFLARRRRCAA
jgi:hypothetical protein